FQQTPPTQIYTLSLHDALPISQLHRHQVTEVPPIKPHVTEYQLHQLCCPACGMLTRADLPCVVAPGGFWPRVHAIVALCTGAYRDRKSTRLNSSHVAISYAVFC